MQWLPRTLSSLSLRAAVGVAALLVASAAGHLLGVLPWLVLVTCLDVAAEGQLNGAPPTTDLCRRRACALLALAAATAGAATVYGGLGAVPLMLLPAVTAGQRMRLRDLMVVTVAAGGTALLISALHRDLTLTETARVLLWVALGSAVALIGSASRHVVPPMSEQDRANAEEHRLASEAGALLRRLHELADSLDTGFDAPASAEMALEQLAARMRSTRSAVLVGFGDDPAVPLAIRGADRTPWPDPTRGDSVLGEAWHTGQPTLTSWSSEDVGRSLVAVPLRAADGQRIGLVVADRPAVTPFTPSDLAAAIAIAAQHSPIIDLSVVFASLRERAGMEERERLAHEMHDGIAQELVAFGFALDALRRSGREVGSALVTDLDCLRTQLSRTLADLRVHIADLRITVRPDSGVGAMISARLQGFGAGSRLTTRMDLNESGFRLPAHTEVLIYRLFLRVLTDVRHAGDATAVSVSLNVAAPRVELQISHDGSTSLDERDFVDHPLVALGGAITVEPRSTRGVIVRMRMRAHLPSSSAELTHERIPQPS